ncbi:hypothetical protein ZHAS_00012936 [Anopheles sinensis]|uniref:Uncharacterized protein n=1 Tax=Anopheles sinensis TaxID=74873 RepID=A0A084W455_ANOSI|nr:hypothetical protein ZHAS_00012936 [Anopheles sinensis]
MYAHIRTPNGRAEAIVVRGLCSRPKAICIWRLIKVWSGFWTMVLIVMSHMPSILTEGGMSLWVVPWLSGRARGKRNRLLLPAEL